MPNSSKITHIDIIGKLVVKALKSNNFEAIYCNNSAQAKKAVLDQVPNNSIVGFGGSRTISDLELEGLLKSKMCTLINHAGVFDPDEKLRLCRAELTADVFLASSNAITMDGQIYNVDMRGNRIAAMLFGPKKVVIVAGINKIVRDEAAAKERVRLIAGPQNSIRLELKNPCVEMGYCIDCQDSTRICNAAVLISKRPSNTEIVVIIVGESLGF